MNGFFLKLQKINKVRLSLGNAPITRDDVVDFVKKAPIFFDESKQDWLQNIIAKELYYAKVGMDKRYKKSYIDGKMLIQYIELHDGNKIYYPLDRGKVIAMLYWWHCAGSHEYRLTIEKDGSMKSIPIDRTHEGFTPIDDLDKFTPYDDDDLYGEITTNEEEKNMENPKAKALISQLGGTPQAVEAVFKKFNPKKIWDNSIENPDKITHHFIEVGDKAFILSEAQKGQKSKILKTVKA